MGTLYVSQAAAGYNATPPADDGSQTASNQITWNTTIKAKLADPIKVLADAINTQLTTVLDLSPRAIAANDSAVASDHWRTLQVTGTTTITLSDAATMTNKYVVGIANLGVGTVTVTRATAGNTVNGTAADFTLLPKQAVILGVNQGANGYNILSASNASGAGIQSLIAATIDSGTTGSLSLKTNNGRTGLEIVDPGIASANWFQVMGSGSGAANALLRVTGSDTNIDAIFRAKGTGGYFFEDDSNAIQFQINRTASSTRNITVTGSNGGNPTISTTAGSLAITPTIVAGASLGLGGTAPAGGGTGIQFPATQSASTDVNNLDDYEEGTWVPSVGGSATYTTQNGNYTKIGRLVYVRCLVKINAIGTGSTNTISGLPFTSNATASLDTGLVVGGLSGIGASVVSAYARVAPSSTSIIIGALTAAGATVSEVVTIFQNGAQVFVSGSYEV